MSQRLRHGTPGVADFRSQPHQLAAPGKAALAGSRLLEVRSLGGPLRKQAARAEKGRAAPACSAFLLLQRLIRSLCAVADACRPPSAHIILPTRGRLAACCLLMEALYASMRSSIRFHGRSNEGLEWRTAGGCGLRPGTRLSARRHLAAEAAAARGFHAAGGRIRSKPCCWRSRWRPHPIARRPRQPWQMHKAAASQVDAAAELAMRGGGPPMDRNHPAPATLTADARELILPPAGQNNAPPLL